MQRLNYRLILFIAVLFFVSCDHYYDSRIVRTCFWTSSAPNSPHHLYINGRDKGVIPYSLTVPRADERNRLLAVNLHRGRFRIEVKDASGNTVYNERFRLKLGRHSTTVQTNTDDEEHGRSKLQHRGKILVKEIYFDE